MDGGVSIYYAVAAAIIGAGVSAYATYETGQQQKAQAQYNSKVAYNNAVQQGLDAEHNAKVSEANRVERLMLADAERKQTLMQGKFDMATLEATLSNRGLDMTTGSGLDVLSTQSLMFEQEANMRMYAGATEALGMDAQARNLRGAGSQALFLGTSQARNLWNQGTFAGRSGTIGSVGTGLSGLGQAGFMYAQGTK